MVIFDTNVLIELYRGNETVKNKVTTINEAFYYVSVITMAEFMVGAVDKVDLKRIEKQLAMYNSLPINAGITDIFTGLIKLHALSHRHDVPDTLIAATALYYDLPLYTLNTKHFQFIPGIQLI